MQYNAPKVEKGETIVLASHNNGKIKEFIDIFDMTGDVNNDNIINVLDIVALVEIILLGPESANDSLEYTDINEDGSVNIIDVISLVNIILD